MTEAVLFSDLPEVVPAPPVEPTRPEHARVVRPVRSQIEWAPRDLDAAIAEEHPVRAIWGFLERLDLSSFYESIKAVVDAPGRPATDPQVLLALWLYATTEGVGSARRLGRLCEQHDAYRWLRGGVPINYHMLADFRVANKEAMDDLLAQILAAMMAEGLVTLQRVAQDGLRIRASAGSSSFRGESKLKECLRQAQEQIECLAEEREHPDPGLSQRERAARERAAREREQRIQRALAQLPAVASAKERVQAKDKKRSGSEPRACATDPDARIMRMGDGGYRPAYNVQFATDSQSGVIVGVGVTNRGADQGEAVPMEKQVAGRAGRHPAEYLVDGGFVKHTDIVALEQAGVQVYAPPAPSRSAEGPAGPQPEDPPEIIRWRARMATEEAKTIYRDRAASAEWVNAQARSRYGMQQFLVRGLSKVLAVALLVAVTHNLLRWMALT